MRHLKTLILTMMAAALAGCGNYLNVQPQGEVIPKTDEEFATACAKSKVAATRM